MNVQEVSCDQKVFCPFCKKKLYPGDEGEYDLESSICKHVLYNHDSEDIYYLSKEAEDQLNKKGFSEKILSDLMYNEEGIFYLRDLIDYPNTLEFEISPGGMTLVTLHIAVSSSL